MNYSKITFLILFLFIGGYTVQAQSLKVPKMDMSSQLLGILDKGADGLSLSSDQKGKLTTDNKSFVDKLMKIQNGSGSDDEKKEGFLNLKNSRTKFLTDLLGSGLFQKYSGNILKSINPLKSKLGLAALAF
ncbi:hypothetical protein [Algoriphagus marinus]|uniref:hypothetical protein n=1 Tax=Algoriphagus marinus TaxID=1925762 RepID=UPI00094B98EE|nr:hypothetical protein [Algoriphagus marinus]